LFIIEGVIKRTVCGNGHIQRSFGFFQIDHSDLPSKKDATELHETVKQKESVISSATLQRQSSRFSEKGLLSSSFETIAQNWALAGRKRRSV